MAATTIFIALSLTTLLGGQNGQGASARASSTMGTTPQISASTPQLQIGARTYSGDRPVATALSGTGDDPSGTVWIDPSGCAVGSAPNVSVRPSPPGPSAVRWTYTGHIVDRVAGGVVADIEWERSSVNYGDASKSTKRVNLRVGESVVIDELAPKAPDNLCGASAMRLEASLVMLGRGSRAGGGAGVGAGAGGRGTTAAGGGGGAGSNWIFAPPSTKAGASGGGSGAGAGGAGAGGFGGLGPPQAGEDLRVRAIAMRDFLQLMTTVQGQGVSGKTSSLGGGNGLLGSMRPAQGAGYDAEAWLVHTPAGGQEETQHVEVHVESDGQAFQFPAVTINTARGPAKVNVTAMLQPVTNTNGDVMLIVAIVRQIDGPGSLTGGSTKIIPLPASTDIISFELPDTHGTAFDVLNGHQFSVRVRIKKTIPGVVLETTPGIISQN